MSETKWWLQVVYKPGGESGGRLYYSPGVPGVPGEVVPPGEIVDLWPGVTALIGPFQTQSHASAMAVVRTHQRHPVR